MVIDVSNCSFRFLLFALILSMMLVACSALLQGSDQHTEDTQELGGIMIIDDGSWLSTFSVVGDMVVFSCRYTIENQSESAVSVELRGDFSPEKEHQLIMETTLHAYLLTYDQFEVFDLESLDEDALEEILSDRNNTKIELQPGKNVVQVLFIGTHGSTDTKSSRLLPELEVTILD